MPFDTTDFDPSQSQPVTVTAKAATEAPSLLDRDPKTITDPKERLMYLRDFLRELPPERFDMTDFLRWQRGGSATAEEVSNHCGTAACIAGWAHVKFDPTNTSYCYSDDVAQPLLGLSDDAAEALFYPAGTEMSDGQSGYMATPTQAANVLDHLIQTGEVDWGKA